MTMADLRGLLHRDWKAVAVCLFICIGAFQYGYDLGYFSGILVMDEFNLHYGSYDAATGKKMVSASTQSLVTSIINAGEFIGAATAFLISERIGLRGGLLASCVIVAIGTTLQVAVPDVGCLIAGRLVLGYAVGMMSNYLPLYIADCAPARLRGALVTMYQFDITLGLVLGVCVDYSSHNRTDTGAFRIPMAVQYVFPIVLGSGLLLYCPESPRWLAANNRISECEVSLRKLKSDEGEIHEELRRINLALHSESADEKASWRDIFSRSSERRKAYLGFAIQAWQQGSGVNFINSYGVYFFTMVGIKNAFLIQVALYITGFPPMWVCQYGLERFGRRPLLILSGLGMALANLTMGGLGLNPHPSYSIAQGIVGLVFIYGIFFCLAWGPAVWVVASEISTGRNRSHLMTLSTCTNWFFTWVISFTFPYLFDADAANLGPRIGFIYGSVMVFASIWIYFLLPETSQRSLEEINQLFEDHVSTRKFASTKLEALEPLQEKEMCSVGAEEKWDADTPPLQVEKAV